jgi:hypothetical protein
MAPTVTPFIVLKPIIDNFSEVGDGDRIRKVFTTERNDLLLIAGSARLFLDHVPQPHQG